MHWRSNLALHGDRSRRSLYTCPSSPLSRSLDLLFLLPRALTRGRAAIRVRLVFTPVLTPLYPGAPLPPLAWSEIRYTAYCYLLPPVEE